MLFGSNTTGAFNISGNSLFCNPSLLRLLDGTCHNIESCTFAVLACRLIYLPIVSSLKILLFVTSIFLYSYCMRVMLQKVPESGWLCEECQAVVETEFEKKKLEKVQENVVMISMENKVDAENMSHKESNEDNEGNGIYIRMKEEDARLIDNNVSCAPCSFLAHCNCPLFPIESEVGKVASGCTPSIKEDDSGLCIVNKALLDCEPMSTDISDILNLKSIDGGIHSLERCNDDVSSISKAKDVSNVAAWNKRLNRQSDAKNYEWIKDVRAKLKCSVLFLPFAPAQGRV